MLFGKAAIKDIDEVMGILQCITGNLELRDKKEDIDISLINAIHTINDWYERMMGSITADEDAYLKGVMYLNNQIKHDKSLTLFSANIYESRYPIIYPYRYGKLEN